jgi:hypothetical protein
MLQNNPALKSKVNQFSDKFWGGNSQSINRYGEINFLRRPYLKACNNLGLFSENYEKTN